MRQSTTARCAHLLAALALVAGLALPALAASPAGQAEEPPPRAWWQGGAPPEASSEKGLPAARQAELLAKTQPGAMLRSLVLPGWGQRYAGRQGRGAFFTGLDIAFALGLVYSHQAWQYGEDQYVGFAEMHAGITSAPNHQFYVDMGNYDSRDEYNEAQRARRAYQNQYTSYATWWEWDSSENRQEFEGLRITADRHRNRMYYFLGGLVINRLLSAVDASRTLSVEQDKAREKGIVTVGYDSRANGPGIVWRGDVGRLLSP